MRIQIHLTLIILVLVTGCESGIIFNAPQPFGETPSPQMPEHLTGDYTLDPSTLENPDPERQITHLDSLLMKQPIMSIRKDAIVFYEYRWGEIHIDSIGNGRYELRDDYLYLNNEQLSKRPVDKLDSVYHYVSRLNEMALPVNPDSVVLFEEGDVQVGLKSLVITGKDYFVLNIGVFNAPNRWAALFFQLTGDGRIAIKQPIDYDDINPEKLKKTARMLDLGKEYLVETANETEFLKVVSLYYKDLFVLTKINP